LSYASRWSLPREPLNITNRQFDARRLDWKKAIQDAKKKKSFCKPPKRLAFSFYYTKTSKRQLNQSPYKCWYFCVLVAH